MPPFGDKINYIRNSESLQMVETLNRLRNGMTSPKLRNFDRMLCRRHIHSNNFLSYNSFKIQCVYNVWKTSFRCAVIEWLMTDALSLIYPFSLSKTKESQS